MVAKIWNKHSKFSCCCVHLCTALFCFVWVKFETLQNWFSYVWLYMCLYTSAVDFVNALMLPTELFHVLRHYKYSHNKHRMRNRREKCFFSTGISLKRFCYLHFWKASAWHYSDVTIFAYKSTRLHDLSILLKRRICENFISSNEISSFFVVD